MFIDKNGTIIYINPENLDKHAINTIDDLRKLLTDSTQTQSTNSINTTTNSDTTTKIIDVAPFSDEIQTPKQSALSSNNKLLDASKMNDLLNEQRNKNNVNNLIVSSVLTKTAEDRCVDMINSNSTADRSSSKIMSSIKSNSGNATLATEILYWGSSSSSYNDAINWWMDEPKYHKANILKTAFKYIGSGICKTNGDKTYFVTVFSN